jgi:hypothetical protein
MMMASLIMIMKKKVRQMTIYWGRLGSFVRGAKNYKIVIKKLKVELRLSKSHVRQTKHQIRVDYDWDGKESNFADSV